MDVDDVRERASRTLRWLSRRTVCDGKIWPPVCRLQARSLGAGRYGRKRQEGGKADGESIPGRTRETAGVMEAAICKACRRKRRAMERQLD